jgi:hypothetical protein
MEFWKIYEGCLHKLKEFKALEGGKEVRKNQPFLLIFLLQSFTLLIKLDVDLAIALQISLLSIREKITFSVTRLSHSPRS